MKERFVSTVCTTGGTTYLSRYELDFSHRGHVSLVAMNLVLYDLLESLPKGIFDHLERDPDLSFEGHTTPHLRLVSGCTLDLLNSGGDQHTVHSLEANDFWQSFCRSSSHPPHFWSVVFAKQSTRFQAVLPIIHASCEYNSNQDAHL